MDWISKFFWAVALATVLVLLALIVGMSCNDDHQSATHTVISRSVSTG